MQTGFDGWTMDVSQPENASIAKIDWEAKIIAGIGTSASSVASRFASSVM